MSATIEQTPDVDVNVTPQEDWSLEQLGEYCQAAKRKMAVCVWRVGTALLHAKKRLPHGEWGKWLEQYCSDWSRATISRYLSLAKRFTEEDLEGVTLMDAYRMAGIRNGAEQGANATNAAATSVARSRRSKTRVSPPVGNSGRKWQEKVTSSQTQEGFAPAPPNPARVSGEVVDPANTSDAPALDEYAALSPEEELREYLSDLPRLLRGFREFIAEIREHDQPMRHACWQEVEFNSIRDQLRALRDDLGWLEEDIPQRAVQAEG